MTATTKMTFGSLLGMITVAANAATRTITVASDGVDMLGETVSKMKTTQIVEHAVEIKQHEREFAANAAKEHSQRMLEINEFRTKSAAHTKIFDESLTSFNLAIAAAKQQRGIAA